MLLLSIEFEITIVVPCLLIKNHLADGHFSDSSRLLLQPCHVIWQKVTFYAELNKCFFFSKDLDPTPIVAKLGVLV